MLIEQSNTTVNFKNNSWALNQVFVLKNEVSEISEKKYESGVDDLAGCKRMICGIFMEVLAIIEDLRIQLFCHY